METLLPWVLTAIGAVVAALAGAVSYLWKQNAGIIGKQVEWRDRRIRELEEKEEKSEKKIDDLEKRVSELEQERTKLEARFLVFQSSHDSSPFPSWFKDLDGTVLACNKAYEVIFLRPRGYSLEDYIGKKDSNVWPPHVAEVFQKNDLKVIQTGEKLDTMETIENQNGNSVPIRVVKYPRRLLGVSDPIGVAGIAIVDDLEGKSFNKE